MSKIKKKRKRKNSFVDLTGRRCDERRRPSTWAACTTVSRSGRTGSIRSLRIRQQPWQSRAKRMKKKEKEKKGDKKRKQHKERGEVGITLLVIARRLPPKVRKQGESRKRHGMDHGTESERRRRKRHNKRKRKRRTKKEEACLIETKWIVWSILL